MVPYSSAVYAEHVFRLMGIQGNAKATSEDADVKVLIEAAYKLRDMVKDMENTQEIKGFVIYREESEEDKQKKKEEDLKLKELIRQNQGGKDTSIIDQEDHEEDFVNPQSAEIIKKYKGKMLKEFIP